MNPYCLIMFPLSSLFLTDYDFFLFFLSTWTASTINAGMEKKIKDKATISKMLMFASLIACTG